MSEGSANSDFSRLPALDGLRGVLATIVLVKHATEEAGWHLHPLHYASQGAVLLFFVLSGNVLTRGWNGDFATFLLRRFVRLWPVYAVTLAVGYVVTAQTPHIGLFFWLPVYVLDGRPPVNLPAWSLHLEAWAMLGMPFFVWAAGGPARRLAVGLATLLIVSLVQPLFMFGYFFLAGACVAKWNFRNRLLESFIPQWLGKISYSLYLTHWLVLTAVLRHLGPHWVLAAIPLTLVVGWLTWRFIELPSIRVSRAIAKARMRKPEGQFDVARPLHRAGLIRSTPPI